MIFPADCSCNGGLVLIVLRVIFFGSQRHETSRDLSCFRSNYLVHAVATIVLIVILTVAIAMVQTLTQLSVLLCRD